MASHMLSQSDVRNGVQRHPATRWNPPAIMAQNVRALRLAVAVLTLKISEKTPGLPLVGSRVLVLCSEGWRVEEAWWKRYWK
jgi:hypothetical protein